MKVNFWLLITVHFLRLQTALLYEYPIARECFGLPTLEPQESSCSFKLFLLVGGQVNNGKSTFRWPWWGAGAKFRISNLPLMHGYTLFSVHLFIFVSMQRDWKALFSNFGRLTIIKQSLSISLRKERFLRTWIIVNAGKKGKWTCLVKWEKVLVVHNSSVCPVLF